METLDKQKLLQKIDEIVNLYNGDLILTSLKNMILRGDFDIQEEQTDDQET